MDSPGQMVLIDGLHAKSLSSLKVESKAAYKIKFLRTKESWKKHCFYTIWNNFEQGRA